MNFHNLAMTTSYRVGWGGERERVGPNEKGGWGPESRVRFPIIENHATSNYKHCHSENK